MRITRTEPRGIAGLHGVEMSMLAAGDRPEHVRVEYAVLEEGASLPKHPAGPDQVFVVLSGEGRVAGDDDVEHHVSAGSVVTWTSGEQHTSWADTRMTVVIIQRRPAT